MLDIYSLDCGVLGKSCGCIILDNKHLDITIEKRLSIDIKVPILSIESPGSILYRSHFQKGNPVLVHNTGNPA